MDGKILIVEDESGLATTLADSLRDILGRRTTRPILMPTAQREISDKFTGLSVGGDDYLTKPFQIAELLPRIETLLRRSKRRRNAAEELYHLGEFRINLRRKEASLDGQPIEVSAREFKLPRFLFEDRGATISREELLREVTGYAAVSSRTVDMHVAWLRQKIEEDSKTPI